MRPRLPLPPSKLLFAHPHQHTHTHTHTQPHPPAHPRSCTRRLTGRSAAAAACCCSSMRQMPSSVRRPLPAAASLPPCCCFPAALLLTPSCASAFLSESEGGPCGRCRCRRRRRPAFAAAPAAPAAVAARRSEGAACLPARAGLPLQSRELKSGALAAVPWRAPHCLQPRQLAVLKHVFATPAPPLDPCRPARRQHLGGEPSGHQCVPVPHRCGSTVAVCLCVIPHWFGSIAAVCLCVVLQSCGIWLCPYTAQARERE